MLVTCSSAHGNNRDHIITTLKKSSFESMLQNQDVMVKRSVEWEEVMCKIAAMENILRKKYDQIVGIM